MSESLKSDILDAEMRRGFRSKNGTVDERYQYNDKYILKQDFKKYFSNEGNYYAWMLEHYDGIKLTKLQKWILQMFKTRAVGK